jgi:formylglycine-generating enzyme required for sulfatase activity
MVRIAGGEFVMGAGDAQGNPRERPAHRVALAPYCIDRTEVRAAQYARCVADTSGAGCTPAGAVYAPQLPVAEREVYDRFCNAGHPERAEHPINCVDWFQAEAYCRWAARRLPTEAEWERAARGASGRTYPWGEDPPAPSRLNACGAECTTLGATMGLAWPAMYSGSDGYGATAPVGSFPAGATPEGILDMAGNVAEWVADGFAPYRAEAQRDPTGPAEPVFRVLRGGGWHSHLPARAQGWFRWWDDPAARVTRIGFRCAVEARF